MQNYFLESHQSILLFMRPALMCLYRFSTSSLSFEFIPTPTCILILNTCSVKLYPNPLLRGYKVDQESLRGVGNLSIICLC